MASVGSYTVATMTGTAQQAGESLAEITRPRVDGRAFKKIGKRAQQYQVQTTKDIVAANAEAEKATIMAIKGTIVDLTDDHGNTISDQVVLDVYCAVRAATTIVGGITSGSNAIMECVWTMINPS